MSLSDTATFAHWRASEIESRYHFNLGGQAKQRRTGNNLSALDTRRWEALIADETREQRESVLDGIIGARILYRLPNRVGDLDNYLKSLLDGMQRLAFQNDNQFDYIEICRQVYDGAPLIEMELLK